MCTLPVHFAEVIYKTTLYTTLNTILFSAGHTIWQQQVQKWGEVKWLFNVTINNISVIHVTAHRCAGGLKKKLDLRSGSQRHRHFVGFFNVPFQEPTRGHPFYTVTSPKENEYSYEKYESYTRVRNSGKAFWNMQKHRNSLKFIKMDSSLNMKIPNETKHVRGGGGLPLQHRSPLIHDPAPTLCILMGEF